MSAELVTLGWQVIDWIEAYLVHGPGDVEGDPIELDDELASFVLKAYAVHPRGHPREGRRRYHRAFLSRPKGRAKSEIAGMLACAEALGPVRFDGWDAEGQPVGRPVRSPEILCLATEEEQAGNTYDNITTMLEQGEVAHAYPGIDLGRKAQTSTRVYLPGGGVIQPVTAAAPSKDGGKSTYIVADETHIWVTPQLRQLYATVRRNLGKRKGADPWMLETSTMYRPGQGSVAESTHESWKLGQERTLLFDHREAPRPLAEVIGDDEAFHAALAEVYGPAAAWMDLDRLMAEIRSGLEEPERYYFNQPVHHDDDWMAKEVWAAAAAPDRRVGRGERVTLGFDGSLGTADARRTADSTVLRGCRLSDGHLFTLGLWEAAGPGPWEPNRAGVEVAVSAAFARFDVVRFYADPQHWQTEIGQWAARFGAERVSEWWTNRDTQMAAALERLHTDVTAGSASHDGDARVAKHYRQAKKLVKKAAVSDPDGRKERVLVRKTHPMSPDKIDAVVADALAYEARSDAVAAGALTAEPVREFAELYHR